MKLTIIYPLTAIALLAFNPVGRAGIILGTNTSSLIGNDLTDPGEENGALLDGVVTTVGFTLGTEGGGGEHAYRVFDNGVNRPPPNPTHNQDRTKYCCTGADGTNHITVQFNGGPQVVRSYTISSANDSPQRDPTAWQVLGSNNGTDFTLIDEVTGNTWNARHEVQIFTQFSQGANSTAYEYLRFVPTATGGSQFAISEIEYLGLNANATGTILGTGNGALLGNDRVDTDFNATFFGDNEPFSDGAEGSFNIFDNTLGGGTAKWCCDDPSPGDTSDGEQGFQVGAEFAQGFRLTHFTISSSNDSPERDPLVWSIDGSHNGTDWTTVFLRAHETDTVFSARNQVVRFDGGVDFATPDEAYTFYRYSVTDSQGGAAHALAELEFFGVIPEPATASLLVGGLLVVSRLRKRR